DRRRQDLSALLAMPPGGALYGEVVGLGGAGGEKYLRRLRSDDAGDLFPRFLNGISGFPTVRVAAARRRPESLGKIGTHGRKYARINRRRSVIVHVDRQLHGGSHFLILAPKARPGIDNWWASSQNDLPWTFHSSRRRQRRT